MPLDAAQITEHFSWRSGQPHHKAIMCARGGVSMVGAIQEESHKSSEANLQSYTSFGSCYHQNSMEKYTSGYDGKHTVCQVLYPRLIRCELKRQTRP